MEPNANDGPSSTDSARSARAIAILKNLSGLEAELRGAAIAGPDGEMLACTVDDPQWQRSALDLLAALKDSGEQTLDSSHIATEEAEVFVVTEGELSLVAVTARFVLASLTIFDMRMSLRDLAESHA